MDLSNILAPQRGGGGGMGGVLGSGAAPRRPPCTEQIAHQNFAWSVTPKFYPVTPPPTGRVRYNWRQCNVLSVACLLVKQSREYVQLWESCV